MIRRIDLKNESEVSALLALQQAAYRVEAELINFYDIPPLFDTPESLRASSETFYGYYVDNKLAGVISYQYDGETLDIFRLGVDPGYFKRGIASALLRHIETIEAGLVRMIVSTGSRNTPASRLYERHGFIRLGEQPIGEDITITHYEKKLR